MNLAERKKKLRQSGLWCSLEISEIGYVAVFFVLLMLMMANQPIICGRSSVDLAPTPHAVKMPGAAREDVLQVAIMRDGSIFFRSDKIVFDDLSLQLQEGLKNGAEHKVYISADRRAKYGKVLEVVDAVRNAGIEQIGFITQRPQDLVEP
jgi:biopolymer transport protein ExbD